MGGKTQGYEQVISRSESEPHLCLPPKEKYYYCFGLFPPKNRRHNGKSLSANATIWYWISSRSVKTEQVRVSLTTLQYLCVQSMYILHQFWFIIHTIILLHWSFPSLSQLPLPSVWFPLLSFSPLSSKSHAGLSRSPERKKNESDSSSIEDTGQAYVVGQHAKNNITVFTNQPLKFLWV